MLIKSHKAILLLALLFLPMTVTSETFHEKLKVYGVIKPAKMTTLIGVNQGIVTQIRQVGTSLKQNETALMVMEREVIRPYRTTITGIVAKTHVTAGAAVSPGMPLSTVIDPNEKMIEISLSPGEAKKIKVGAIVLDENQKPFGVIDKLSPLVDTDTGAITSYIKAEAKISSMIGDVIPLFLQTRTIEDCEKVITFNEFDSSYKDFQVEAYSGDRICLKKKTVNHE